MIKKAINNNLFTVVVVLLVMSACSKTGSKLVIRGDLKIEDNQFDSVLTVGEITESMLQDAGHLFISAEVNDLTFKERSYVERYLEAGGLVTFSCRDTIYNWGQIKPFFNSGTAKIDCEQQPLSKASLDYSKVKSPAAPGLDRLVRQVLVAPLAEPMDIMVTENSLVYWIERKGQIHTYNPGTDQTKQISQMDVYTGEEDGLLGIVLDPNFSENNWVYIFYSPPGDEPKQHVSRFVLTPDSLHLCTEKLIIEIPTQREECCHSAGDLVFDRDGNLYISTGDNTFSRASDGFTPLDERPGRSPWDSQKSSSNSNDKRGKVLRIHPEMDGSYTIPDGNLFPKDGSQGLPEVYVMGARNPFTMAYNLDKDWLYWGDVGPDGNVTSERGPSAHDEINFAKAPGNYGWPYFNANNLAYADYDFETLELGPRFDPAHPKNTSVNNTGIVDLPPAVPAMIYYSFDETPLFPGVGKGSRSTGAGDIYNYRETRKHGYEFPAYYDNKLIAFDWARDWIKVVSQDEEGNFQSIEPLLDNSVLASPIAMDFGPDGALYVLEYGIGYFTDNHDSKLIKLEFVNGNRPPVATFESSELNGSLPLTIELDASASNDPDGDALNYEWRINDEILTGAKNQYTFNGPGKYEVELEVSDAKGSKATFQRTITAGNSAPELKIAFDLNSSFYVPGQPIKYSVNLTDAEDGSLDNGIDPNQLDVSLARYEGSDNRAAASLAQLGQLDGAGLSPGLQLIQTSDCKSCHKINEKSIGPSFTQIADKYDQDYIQMDLLAKKIINGGSGVWGDGMMIAHPNFSMKAAREIVRYIFTVNDPPPAESEAIGISGVIATSSKKENIRFEAQYVDRGGNLSLTNKVEVTLTPPVLQAELADDLEGFDVQGGIEDGDARTVSKTGEKAILKFEGIDLSSVSAIVFDGKSSSSGAIHLVLDADFGNINSTVSFEEGQTMKLNLNESGIHDLYFIFESDGDLTINELQFNLFTR
ncbi:MAG: PKD domain-containing protein [Flammeovirgaceae bacterium]|nr:PKD domain-containing protein [Flammeovirgaceae bacterium]MBE63247.1 PKD domain-containing protein [Flammeovirgaceae bacterium]HCX22793.1 PKD domain-containing protein [Cytophagales bacterium]